MMSDDIASNFELGPILKGVVVAVIFMIIAWITSIGFIGMFGIILGSAVSGFLTVNSTKHALVYGAIVGFICCLPMMTIFSLPVFIILGLFGGFIGKVIQSNIGME